MHPIAIHGEQDVETPFLPSGQGAVLKAGPANQRHGLNGVTGEVAPKPPVQVLIQQEVHLNGLQQFIARSLQHREDLLPADAGETFQKIHNRVPRLKVVEKTPDWHPRSEEHRRASEGFRV